jgi:hypothetical protein
MTEAQAATAAEPESVEEVEARGYRGQADERDRSEYALTTGPDSPSALETTLDAKRADAAAQLDEFKARARERAESVKAKARTAHEERSAARHARRES